MSTLFYNLASTSLPPSDTIANATSTVTRIDGEAEASVATSTPESGRLETDAVTEGGLTTHQVASQVTPVRTVYPGNRFAFRPFGCTEQFVVLLRYGCGTRIGGTVGARNGLFSGFPNSYSRWDRLWGNVFCQG